MKDIPSDYRSQFTDIPQPLQKQILLRFGYALVFLLFCVCILFIGANWLTTIPCFAISIYCLFNAICLFHTVIAGKYIIIRGLYVSAERTLFQKRVKSVLIRNSEHSVQINTHIRIKHIGTGTKLIVYVADNTPVYDIDGIKHLYAYLAIAHECGVRCDKKRE